MAMTGMTLVLRNGFLEAVAEKPVLRRTLSSGCLSPSSSISAADISIDVNELRRLSAEAKSPRVKAAAKDEKCMVMLRNLPNKVTQRMLVNILLQQGFENTFDFVHIPVDPVEECGLGYAYVHFIDAYYANEAVMVLKGLRTRNSNSKKVLSAEVAEVQGIGSYIRRLHKRRPQLFAAECAPEIQPLRFDTETGREVPFRANLARNNTASTAGTPRSTRSLRSESDSSDFESTLPTRVLQ